MLEPASLTQFKRQLDARVIDWMVGGVFIETTPEEIAAWQAYWSLVSKHRVKKLPTNKIPRPNEGQPANDQLLRGLVRSCAKDLGRPFVWVSASISEDVNVWEVKIPNTVTMKPIVSMLLLGAHTIAPAHKGALPGVCNYTSPVASNYVFQITDDALVEKWLDRCKNDPVFQNILGNLPEKVT